MASIYQRGKVWWLKFHLNGKRIQQSLNGYALRFNNIFAFGEQALQNSD